MTSAALDYKLRGRPVVFVPGPVASERQRALAITAAKVFGVHDLRAYHRSSHGAYRFGSRQKERFWSVSIVVYARRTTV